MDIWWIFLLFIYKSVADQSESELTNNGGILQVEISTKNIGRIKYRDGEVVIAQNQQKHTDFFFAPFPYIQPEETQCHENVLASRIELGLQIELYTPQLIEAVKDYLSKYQSSLCGNMTSSSVCDVSLLPMNSIRLVQRGLHSNSTPSKYILEESWQSATLLLQSMEFVIYASDIIVCEQLRRALTEKCRLPNLELHYSLHGQQTVQRQLEANGEHVASTNMYNQIRAQFPSTETVLLTGGDLKELLSESTDRITMTLRMQEGFESLHDPMNIEKLLERQLSTEQVKLETGNNKSWENLYWTPESTRPDRLAKILNSIVRKESGDSKLFVYDRQVAKDAMQLGSTQHEIYQSDLARHDISEVGLGLSRQDIDRADLNQHDIDHLDSLKQYGDRAHLTYHDKQRLGRFDKLFDSHNRSSSSKNSGTSKDDDNDSLEFFGKFKISGGSKSESQKQLEISKSRVDVSNKKHGKISEVDMLNVKRTGKHSVNALVIGQNHLNETWTDKERSTATRINSNKLNVTKINNDTDKQYTLSRHSVEKLLREFFDSVYLDGEIIKPRPINARLVKIGKLTTNTKLFSNTVLVRMRSNVHVMPVRCKSSENGGKSELWLTDRIDQIENAMRNLSNHVQSTKLRIEMEQMNNLYMNLTATIQKVLHTAKNDPELRGFLGVPGADGLPGLKGLPGEKGDHGFSGLSGLPGLPGANGLPGHKGLPGEKGDLGFSGLSGLPGVKGGKGDQGFTGLPGEDGSRGVPGTPGSRGLPGEKGDLGRIGFSGANGERGPPGPRGPPGKNVAFDKPVCYLTNAAHNAWGTCKFGGVYAGGISPFSGGRFAGINDENVWRDAPHGWLCCRA